MGYAYTTKNVNRLMQHDALIHRIRQLSAPQRAKLATLLREAHTIEQKLPAWTITIQLMGDDIGPDDTEVSIPKKLNFAANKLALMTGASKLDWVWSPKPSFSFQFPKPRLGVKITLINDEYTVEFSQPGTISRVFGKPDRPSKVPKTVRGVGGDQLRQLVQRESGLVLSF